MTERFGHLQEVAMSCRLGGRVMFRDRDTLEALAVTTRRPAWQKKDGADSPAAPAPVAKAPDTAKPGGPIVPNSAPEAKPKRRLKRNVLAAAGLLAVLGVGGWYGQYWWTAGRYLVSTDDAYVGAKNTTLAAKVSGYVDAVLVEDNAHVRAGDVIAKIDDGDYRLAVDSARGKVTTQQATIARIGKQVEAQQAAIDQAKGQRGAAPGGGA